VSDTEQSVNDTEQALYERQRSYYLSESIALKDAENKIRKELVDSLGLVNWTLDEEGYIVSSDQRFNDELSAILDAKHESLHQYRDWRP